MTHTPLRANVETAPTETFAERLVRALNDGALCPIVSLGHSTALFDIMDELPPSTVEEIAPCSTRFRACPTTLAIAAVAVRGHPVAGPAVGRLSPFDLASARSVGGARP